MDIKDKKAKKKELLELLVELMEELPVWGSTPEAVVKGGLEPGNLYRDNEGNIKRVSK